MTITNYCLVTKALLYLKDGLMPFVSQEFINRYRGQTHQELEWILRQPVEHEKKPFQHLDVSALLRVMWDSWNEVYQERLKYVERRMGYAARSLVSELRDVRHRWAHQQPFSSDDAYRALDSTYRLLALVSSPQAAEVEKAKIELLGIVCDEPAEFTSEIMQLKEITNDERVATAIEYLRVGLVPFVSQEFVNRYRGRSHQELERILRQPVEPTNDPFEQLDLASLFQVMLGSWQVYRKTLEYAGRSLIYELQGIHIRWLRGVHNHWAPQQPFSSDDAYRALDSTHRLLTLVSAPEAAEVEKAKMELLPVLYDEQAKSQYHKIAQKTLSNPTDEDQTPQREVVVPHKDVTSEDDEQAETARDLSEHDAQAETAADPSGNDEQTPTVTDPSERREHTDTVTDPKQKNWLRRLGMILKRKRRSSSSKA